MVAAAVAGRNRDQSPKDTRNRPPTSNPYNSPRNRGSGRTPSVSPLSQNSKTYKDSVASNNRTDTNIRQDEDESAASNHGESRDRSSSLSDIDESVGDQDNDDSATDGPSTPAAEEEDESEAETERVDPTPRKGGNPSKMSMTAALHAVKEDNLSDTDSVRASEDRDLSRQPPALAGRKRKRTLLSQDAVAMARSDDSDSDSGLAKKRGIRQSVGLSVGEQIERELLAEVEEQTNEEADQVATPDLQSPSKRSAKGRGRSHKKQPPQVEEEAVDVEVEGAEEQEVDAEVEADVEADAEDNLAPEEVNMRTEVKGVAHKLNQAHFSARSHAVGSRINQAERELVQLALPEPDHLEYIRQLQAVTDRRDLKIQQEMKLLQYKKQALRTHVLGSRSQLLSQYIQEARDVRDDKLYSLGQLFYNIQMERRLGQSDELDQYVTSFPAQRSDQIKHQTKYNTEVSILSGVAKYVGFPAAPDIVSARPQELDDDMRAMRIMRRQPPPTYHPVRPQLPSSAPTSERLAQKEFLEQTPWANPHHPVHAQSRTPSAFGNQGLGAQTTGPYGLPSRAASTFATPHPGADRQPGDNLQPGSNETIGQNEASAPPAADRIRLMPFEQGGDLSPTAQIKRAPGGKRDFSGLSNASTIDMPQDGPMDDWQQAGRLDGPGANQSYLTSAAQGQPSQS